MDLTFRTSHGRFNYRVGAIIIHDGKLLLMKNPEAPYLYSVGGRVGYDETTEEAAVREVLEETSVHASIIKYIGKSQYSFNVPEDTVEKDVHWYLMMANNYYSQPQKEEFFLDSGYYKYHEAYHLLKFSNERQILEIAYNEYMDLKKANLWGNRKYY